ncbi:MAG: glycosyltransferase [Nitrospirae bacterium]|nr:glycosyltransferase [Candidatus Manganitrophaceae bacterium]
MAERAPVTVLHLISRLPSGGVENQLRKVVRLYDRRLFRPIVCCMKEKGETGEAIERDGTPVIVLNRMQRHTFDLRLVGLLRRLMREQRVTILRTHQFHANLYGRIAAISAGVPVILPSFHNTYARRKRHRSVVNWLLARGTDRLITVSDAVKRDLIRYDHLPEEKIKVIHNGCDIDRFMRPALQEDLRVKWKIPAAAPVIGTVGRLAKEKGQALLIEAVSLLQSEFPDLHLIIVGEGPEREALEKEGARRGLGNRLILTGLQREVPDYLALMNLFVFPSLNEGFSNALLEAMAAGKPVIASDIVENVEILPSEKFGLRVPPNDAGALAEKIRFLLKNPSEAEAMGRRAQARVAAEFTDAIMMEKIQRLYQTLLQEKKIWVTEAGAP